MAIKLLKQNQDWEWLGQAHIIKAASIALYVPSEIYQKSQESQGSLGKTNPSKRTPKKLYIFNRQLSISERIAQQLTGTGQTESNFDLLKQNVESAYKLYFKLKMVQIQGTIMMKYVRFLTEAQHTDFEMTRQEINAEIIEGATIICDEILPQIENKFLKALILLSLAQIFQSRNLQRKERFFRFLALKQCKEIELIQ